jgi:enoyl-CoA hydratase
MVVEAKDVASGVRLLTLNRPPANAINRELGRALFDQCAAAAADDSVRAVIVTGAGRFFCGGLDLRELVGDQSPLGRLGSTRNDGVFALWTLPKPTVAMVNGHAVAGGAVIALACDFRITCRGNHKMGLNEVAIGLGFPIGSLEIVRQAVGERNTRHVLLGAKLHDVDSARDLRMVDEVVEPSALEARCVELASQLAASGQLAYAHTKKTLQRKAIDRIDAMLPENSRELSEIVRSEETKQLLQAQLAAVTKK